MTPPTTPLADALGRTADDLLERRPARGPDAAELWARGRRVTRLARAGAAALVAVVVVAALALGWAVRGVPVTLPAEGGVTRYPTLVSDLFPATYRADGRPVFGVVEGPFPDFGMRARYVVDRRGVLALVPGTSRLAEAGPRSPDGRWMLVGEGVVDLSRGSLHGRIRADSELATRDEGGVWSPDSRHVLVRGSAGPAVIDLFADTVMAPAPGDGGGMLPAGWADPETALGVRVQTTDQLSSVRVMSRRLDAAAWQPVSTVEVGGVKGHVVPTAAHASPDGSRVLLHYPVSAGSLAGWAVLVDTRTGQQVDLPGAPADGALQWDACPPVWQGDEPLLASNGLHRPGDGSTVLAFTGRIDLDCISFAGQELTGTPDPRSAGEVREQVWRVVAPLAVVLALVVAGWTVVALRRSRRLGERFLPMIWVQRL